MRDILLKIRCFERELSKGLKNVSAQLMEKLTKEREAWT